MDLKYLMLLAILGLQYEAFLCCINIEDATPCMSDIPNNNFQENVQNYPQKEIDNLLRRKRSRVRRAGVLSPAKLSIYETRYSQACDVQNVTTSPKLGTKVDGTPAIILQSSLLKQQVPILACKNEGGVCPLLDPNMMTGYSSVCKSVSTTITLDVLENNKIVKGEFKLDVGCVCNLKKN